MQKLCKNCKNYVKRLGKEGACHRKTKEEDVITGKPVYENFRTVAERKNTDHRHCGPNGQFFEPKMTKKLINKMANRGENE